MPARPYDIRQRTFLFAREVVAFCRTVGERDYIVRRLAGQLAGAAGSVGANLAEAYDGQSKADFISKNCIALKECREARFWLRLIAATDPTHATAAAPLITESEELAAILTAIIRKARTNPARGGHQP